MQRGVLQGLCILSSGFELVESAVFRGHWFEVMFNSRLYQIEHILVWDLMVGVHVCMYR